MQMEKLKKGGERKIERKKKEQESAEAISGLKLVKNIHDSNNFFENTFNQIVCFHSELILMEFKTECFSVKGSDSTASVGLRQART